MDQDRKGFNGSLKGSFDVTSFSMAQFDICKIPIYKKYFWLIII